MTQFKLKTFNPSDRVRFIDELPLWSAPFGLRLLDCVEFKPNLTALDIGFGTGFPLVELAMRLGNTCKVYGIDPWKEAIERASEKISYFQVPNIEIIEGVAESIPLPDRSIDLITSNNGINNVSDLDKVLSECARVAKPGARFVQTMNLNRTMYEFYDQLEEVLLEFSLEKEIEDMHAHIYHKRRPLAEMISRLEQHGFEINDVQQDQFQYRFTNATAMFEHAFVQLAFLPSWISILPPERADEILFLVEARLNETPQPKQGITLTIPFVVIDARK